MWWRTVERGTPTQYNRDNSNANMMTMRHPRPRPLTMGSTAFIMLGIVSVAGLICSTSAVSFPQRTNSKLHSLLAHGWRLRYVCYSPCFRCSPCSHHNTITTGARCRCQKSPQCVHPILHLLRHEGQFPPSS